MAQKTVSYVTPITAGTYGSGSQVPVVTLSAQGAVTAITTATTTAAAVGNNLQTVLQNNGIALTSGDVVNGFAVVSDPNGNYVNGTGGPTGTDGINVPQTGVYLITFSCFASVGIPSLLLSIDGGGNLCVATSATAATSVNGSVIFVLTAGQKVRLSALSNFTMSAVSGFNTFTMQRLS